MRNQMYYLHQLQQFDNRMDTRYKNGLPTRESGRKLTAKQLEYIKERKKITRKIKPYLLRYYMRMRESNIGSSVVAHIVNCVCQGCYMQVTKSLLGELIRGDTAITCEHCGRLLYLTKEELSAFQDELVMA